MAWNTKSFTLADNILREKASGGQAKPSIVDLNTHGIKGARNDFVAKVNAQFGKDAVKLDLGKDNSLNIVFGSTLTDEQRSQISEMATDRGQFLEQLKQEKQNNPTMKDIIINDHGTVEMQFGSEANAIGYSVANNKFNESMEQVDKGILTFDAPALKKPKEKEPELVQGQDVPELEKAKKKEQQVTIELPEGSIIPEHEKFPKKLTKDAHGVDGSLNKKGNQYTIDFDDKNKSPRENMEVMFKKMGIKIEDVETKTENGVTVYKLDVEQSKAFNQAMGIGQEKSKEQDKGPKSQEKEQERSTTPEVDFSRPRSGGMGMGGGNMGGSLGKPPIKVEDAQQVGSPSQSPTLPQNKSHSIS